jgi:hypothetical protein
MPEMKCRRTRVIEDMVQILLRTSREGPVHIHLSAKAPDVSVLGMASLPRASSTANLEYPKWKFDKCDCGAA